MPDLDQIKQGGQVAVSQATVGNPAGLPRGCRDHINREEGERGMRFPAD
jgi:hypothetical protein